MQSKATPLPSQGTALLVFQLHRGPPSTDKYSFISSFFLYSLLMLYIFDCHSSSFCIFTLQPSFTFSYYGRVGSQRFRPRRVGLFSPRPITSSRSLNDLSDIQQHPARRPFQLSVGSLSSEGSSSEEGPDEGTTVRLLWLSMFKVNWKLMLFCCTESH